MSIFLRSDPNQINYSTSNMARFLKFVTGPQPPYPPGYPVLDDNCPLSSIMLFRRGRDGRGYFFLAFLIFPCNIHCKAETSDNNSRSITKSADKLGVSKAPAYWRSGDQDQRGPGDAGGVRDGIRRPVLPDTRYLALSRSLRHHGNGASTY